MFNVQAIECGFISDRGLGCTGHGPVFILVEDVSPPAGELGNEGPDPESAGEEVIQANRIFRGYGAADVLVP